MLQPLLWRLEQQPAHSRQTTSLPDASWHCTPDSYR